MSQHFMCRTIEAAKQLKPWKRPLRLHLGTAFVAWGGACAFPVAAQSAAQIEIEGRVLLGTCQAAADSDLDKTVSMPELVLDDIAAIHDGPVAASEKRFQVHLIDCIGVRGVDISFSGTPQPGYPALYRNTHGTFAATGLALQLRADDGTGLGSGVTVNPAFDTAKHELVFSGRATYYRLPGTTPSRGFVSSNVTVIVTYR